MLLFCILIPAAVIRAEEPGIMQSATDTLQSAGDVGTGKLGWAAGWRYAFSKEGVRQWKPEFTARYFSGFVSDGFFVSGGVRVDDKRTFSLMVGQSDTYLDYAPGDLYTIQAAFNFRRYWHLGKRKIFAIYADLNIGAAYIYKVTGKYHYLPDGGREEVIPEDVGDFCLIGGLYPGLRVRFYKNLHVFVGPTLAADCLGFHLGIGF